MPRKITVFNALLKYIPRKKFDEIVDKYDADKWCKNFFCWDLFIVLLHGQLSGQTSMRTVELTSTYQISQFKAIKAKTASLSTLSDACKVRNPSVFMDVFWNLLTILKKQGKVDKNLRRFIHLIDSTPINLKGYGYEWTKDNHRIKGLKVHTMYDSELKSPIHFTMTAANINDVTEGKEFPLKKGGIYIFDKGYYDYKWWNDIHKKESLFVTRLKKDAPFKIKKRNTRKGNLVHDWLIQLTSKAGQRFKGLLRHIRVKLENKKTIVIVTNDLKSSAEHIAKLYKKRWEIELFFKCLKQNLKIKHFWGKSENAVKLQIVSAMIAYVLIRLTQVKSKSKLTVKQLRIIICQKLNENTTIYRILKIPNKQYARETWSQI